MALELAVHNTDLSAASKLPAIGDAAPGAERPPSEQGPAYLALDALAELQRQVADLATKPAVVVNAAGNWWDVLPRPESGIPPWVHVFPTGQQAHYPLPIKSSQFYSMLGVAFFDDRMELSLRINGGWVVWQRALFYEGGPRG